ncbi:hypothetical protein R54767_04384 [Paraburkholderia gardini]|uniref:Transposase n=2 Tax=Paraburkholderia gardini TaxID=2823469 RepID=A0ABM8U8Y8_9BURK|nr:hypothetical protein R54767_04384 [Paraburkholderia gardini]
MNRPRCRWRRFTGLPACLVNMEACGSAHYWARRLAAMGHTYDVREIDRKIDAMEVQIRQWHRHSEASQRLAGIPGIRVPTGDRTGWSHRRQCAGL